MAENTENPTVEIELTYELTCILLETLEDLIAIESDTARPALLEIHSQVLGGALEIKD